MVKRPNGAQIFLFLFFLLLPFQFALNPLEGIDLALSRAIVLGVGGFFLAERLRSGSLPLPSPRFLFPMVGFFFIGWLSLFWSQEPMWTIRKAFFFVSFLPIWFLLVDTFLRDGVCAVRYIARGFFFGAVLSALVSLFQFFAPVVFSLNQVLSFWLRQVYPLFLGEAFSQAVATYPSLLVNISGKTILRAVGVFPDPHVAAFYFGMAIPFGWWLGAIAFPEKRTFFFLGTALLFLMDLCTFSRGGYVGLIGMSIFLAGFFLYRFRSKISQQQKRAIGVVSIIIVSIFCLVAPIRNRLVDTFSLTEGSNRTRIIIWEEAVSFIAERPLLGYGLGNYSLKVKPSAEYREPIYAHNMYLDLSAELGIIGLIFFLGAFLAPVAIFFFRGHHSDIAFPAVFSSLLFFVHSLFENVLFSVHIFPVLLFLSAILLWYYEDNFSYAQKRATFLE